MTDLETMLGQLCALANPANVAGMARYGINTHGTLGVSLYELRRLAKGIHDHALALQLWDTGIHEARILACIIDVPAQVTGDQLERWVKDLDSWDVCDQFTTDLVWKTPFAWPKVTEWAARAPEFERRAAFALLAGLAFHDRQAPDQRFVDHFPLLRQAATDERNFVKKAVNWALRNIGKRSADLRPAALAFAQALLEELGPTSRSAAWIARDAIRELSAPPKARMRHAQ